MMMWRDSIWKQQAFGSENETAKQPAHKRER
jgi:hypothetical protein